jgi:hypothetical protein
VSAKGKAIVIVGNLSEGFTAVGPFEDMEAALSSDAASGPDTWCMTLVEPKSEHDEHEPYTPSRDPGREDFHSDG